MPNHCYQSVYIRGPRAMVQELYFNLDCKDPRFCAVVVPMPLHEAGNSYEWCNANWGTKWDVADVEIMEKLLMSDEEGPEEVAWFAFKCWTAWAPPVPVWNQLHALGIDVEADYEDEGGMFAGEYQYGEGDCWVPEAEDWCQACEDGTCPDLSPTEEVA